MPAQKKLAKDQIEQLTAEDMRDFMYGAIQDMVEANAPENVSFQYFTPPMPFGPELASFMSLGSKKQDFKKQGLDNNDIARAAVNFATIVDYVPLVKDEKDIDTGVNVVDINTLISSGVKISDLYRSILTNCRVFNNERSKEDQEKLEKLRALLYKDFPEDAEQDAQEDDNEEIDNPLDELDTLLAGSNDNDLDDDDLLSLGDEDDDSSDSWDELMSDGASKDDFVSDPDAMSEPTRAKKLYDILEFKYNQTVYDAIKELKDLSPNDPNANLIKKVIRSKLRSAKNRWISQGRKVKIENIMARIEQLSQEGMPKYVSNLRAIFAGSEMNPSIFSDPELGQSLLSEKGYYTALRPNGVLEAPNLLKITLNNSNSHTWKKFEQKRTQGKAIIPLIKIPGFVSGGASKATKSVNSSFLKEDFSIEFEVVQAVIDRPWLDLGFLESRAYTTVDPRTNEALDPVMQITKLSDGKRPPEDGLLPAIPVTAYFIRNLKITSNSLATISDKESESFRGKAGINILGFGGGISRQSTKTETDFSRAGSKGTIEAKGTFLVGMSSRYLKKAPNPDFDAFPRDKWV